MIPFKMKILNYNPNGSYSVEYTPEESKCTPIKLEIHVNVNDLSNTTEVLNMLKNSSPQDYWMKELRTSEGINHNLLQGLVNTEHSVSAIEMSTPEDTVIVGTTSPTTPVTRSSFTPTIPSPEQVIENSRANIPSATPEQVAGPSEVAAVRLRVAIQHVLQEMAEGTI